MDAGNQSQPSNQVSSCFTAALTDSQVVLGSHTDSWRSCFFNEPVQWLDQLRNWTSRHIQYICREVYNHSNSVVPVEITYQYACFGCALWWRKLEKQQLHNKGQLYDRTEAKSWRSSVILATLASPPLRRWFYGLSSHRCGLQIPYGSHSPFTSMSR